MLHPQEFFYTIFPILVDLAHSVLMLAWWLLIQPLMVIHHFFINDSNLYSLGTVLTPVFFGLGIFYLAILAQLFQPNILIATKSVLRSKKAEKSAWYLRLPERKVLVVGILTGFLFELIARLASETYIVAELLYGYVMLPYIFVAGLGLASSFFFAGRLIVKTVFSLHSPTVEKIKLSILITLIIAPVVVVTIVALELFLYPYGNLQASRFFVLHAAIKNSCFMDPEREHCPTTLEEINYLEPKEYQMHFGNPDFHDRRPSSEILKPEEYSPAYTQASYRYYPEENNYTFIVRYSPIQAVIFDQRLVSLYGVDFREYKVDILGTDRIVDPPDFLGPVEFEQWEY